MPNFFRCSNAKKMPSDAKKKREAKKKEAAKARTTKRPTAAADQTGDDVEEDGVDQQETLENGDVNESSSACNGGK